MTLARQSPPELALMKAILDLEAQGADTHDLIQELGKRLNPTGQKSIPRETPKQFILYRPGRGGKSYPYVEGGYIKTVLNDVFRGEWDWQLVGYREFVGGIHEDASRLGMVIAHGRLTVHIHNDDGVITTITKESTGGSDIKRTKTGSALSIEDDVKSAETDALKRCASLLGIAADVYWNREKMEMYNNL